VLHLLAIFCLFIEGMAKVKDWLSAAFAGKTHDVKQSLW
jgi:hypothetical protein